MLLLARSSSSTMVHGRQGQPSTSFYSTVLHMLGNQVIPRCISPLYCWAVNHDSRPWHCCFVQTRLSEDKSEEKPTRFSLNIAFSKTHIIGLLPCIPLHTSPITSTTFLHIYTHSMCCQQFRSPTFQTVIQVDDHGLSIDSCSRFCRSDWQDCWSSFN